LRSLRHRPCEECVIEEPDHAPLVFLRSRVDAAGVPAAGYLPDRLRLAGRPVIRWVEIAFAGLSVLAEDEEDRRGGDATDEVLEALGRRLVAEERDPRGERDRSRDLEPPVASGHVEVFA